MGGIMARNPKVSVIMPAYNSARFITEAVGSVIAQTYADWELIIIDDGSTDETGAIIGRLASQEARIKALRQQNAGPSAARNFGLRHASGDFVAFLDADDLWSSDKLEKQIRLSADYPGAVLYSQAEYIYSLEGQHVEPTIVTYEDCEAREQFLIRLLTAEIKPAITCSVLIEKKLLEKAGTFDESLENAEDWDLWIRLADHAPFKLIREPLVKRRKHNHSQTSGLTIKRMIHNHFKVLDKYCRSHAHNSVLPQKTILGSCYYDAAKLYADTRHPMHSFLHLIRCGLVAPSLLNFMNVKELAAKWVGK